MFNDQLSMINKFRNFKIRKLIENWKLEIDNSQASYLGEMRLGLGSFPFRSPLLGE